MPMAIVQVVAVFEPLLKLPVPADLVGSDPGPQLSELRAELVVDAKNLARLDHPAEQRTDNLVIHGGAHDQAALLGRIGRPGDQPSPATAGIFHEVVGEEQRGFLQDRIGPIAEELPVAAVQVVPPEVLAEPCAAGRPDAVVRRVDRRRAAPACRPWGQAVNSQ